MPVIPNLLEHLILLDLNQGPGVMLDFLGAQAFRAVGVAVRLGVFETLAGEPLTAPQVADRIDASDRGTTLLLDALDALGYVRQRDGRYFNTPMAAKWLLRDSPHSFAGGVPFFESMVFERWDYLDESIRRGEPAHTPAEWLAQHPDGYRIYEQGMIAVARMAAGEVVARVRLPSGARRLLDVGGGHGLYSVAFCRKHPGLTATVFDLPEAIVVARETIAAEGMGERVGVIEGDYWLDDPGAGYDVLLLFNVIHAHPPDRNVELLGRLAGMLNRGGLLVIMEQMVGPLPTSTAKALARLQALNYFNDLNAQTYTFDQIAGWLAQTGFVHPRRINLLKTPGFSLALATRAA